jgi:peptidoglycan/LPS O-acetylase OafA/YrhL
MGPVAERNKRIQDRVMLIFKGALLLITVVSVVPTIALSSKLVVGASGFGVCGAALLFAQAAFPYPEDSRQRIARACKSLLLIAMALVGFSIPTTEHPRLLVVLIPALVIAAVVADAFSPPSLLPGRRKAP